MRVVILGNSGSGKSTLARWIGTKTGTRVLDLDTIAWMPNEVAVPRAKEEALRDLETFCEVNSSWIVEGCYANLIQPALNYRPALLFLNPGVEACISNCRTRPWEEHKFASKSEQDSHLEHLLKWVREYSVRECETSLAAHRACFDRYEGLKREIREVIELEGRIAVELISSIS